MTRRGTARWLLFLAASAGGASGAEFELRAANQIEGYYDTALEESVVDDRLDLDLGYDRFSAGLVFLSHAPSNPSRLDPNAFGFQTQGIRKRWVTARHGGIEARLGDCEATFGAGLVLRIFEDQAVDFDNSVDGARLGVEWRTLALEAITGANTHGEAATLVKGLSCQWQPVDAWSLGASGALVDSVAGEIPAPGRDQVGGLAASGSLPGGVSATGEYAVRHYRPEREGRRSPDDGHGAYLAFSGGAGPVHVLLEGKDLLRFKHAYATPPTALRQHARTLLSRASHLPNIRLEDERGFQTEALVDLGRGVLWTGNVSRWEARHAPLPGWETYGQLDFGAAGSQWTLHAGETEDRLIEGDHRLFTERITFGADGVHSFASWSIEAAYETQGVRTQNLARRRLDPPREYRDDVVTVTVGRAPVHAWSATFEWTDDALAAKDAWLWLEWSIRLGVLGQLNLGGGATRGGQVCSGGVCKIVAPFEGGRVELLTNF